MTFECITSLSPADVIANAKQFFGERVPQAAAYPEQEGDSWLTLRGQGGEEIAIAITEAGGRSHVRASTLFFDQPLDRFLATLPPAGIVA